MTKKEMRKPQHRWHELILLTPAVVFILLVAVMPWNIIYSASLALFIGALVVCYCRPDLIKKIWIGGLLFLLLYLIFFLVLVVIFPRFVAMSWNLSALSGVVIFGIPIEELLFAFTFGMLWSSLYEHFLWLKLRIK